MDKLSALRARLRRRSPYGPLRRRIFWQLTLLGFGSLAFLCFEYTQMPRGIIARLGVALLQQLQGLDYWVAVDTYNRIVYGHFNFIFAALVLVVFFFFLRFALSWFMRYFTEIERGLDGLLREDGQAITFSPELQPMEKKFNTVRETLARRRAERQQAEQRKNDLVMYLAHDIRTPLTSVIGYLSLLAEAPDMPAEQKARYTGIALEKAQRLEGLVNEFFEITRYDLHEMVLEQSRFDLHYLLVQLCDEFYPVLTAHGNTVELRAPEALTVYGDADKLARVFNNLLKNAVAYSDAGTPITVEADVRETGVTVRVTNRGRTIPPERLNAVFERFYRLDSARSSDSGGAGLGLAIAREIVLRHGGAITAESDAGVTVFTVALPPAPPAPPAPQAELNPPLAES